MNKLVERLQDALKSRGWTRVKFAQEVGMSVSSAYDYCNGRREPSLDILMRICVVLGESSDYMLGIVD